MKNIFDFFMKNDIGEPPWEYDFLVNLDEKEYPKYLAKIFNYRTGEKLPLKYDFKKQAWVIDKNRCKTFNQKIQWIKLYGVTDLMRRCTDKVAVRDYVKEKIGEEYLKPVLQIIPEITETGFARHSEPNDNLEGEESRPALKSGDTSASNSCPPQYDWKLNDVSTYFDQIQWDKLPNAFVIKTNHGSKWQYIIKDKEQFLKTPQLFETVKRNMTGWLEQDYFPFNGFEIQYKLIEPKIIIEPLLREDINTSSAEIEVYCFNRHPKIILKLFNDEYNSVCLYDENLNCINDIFSEDDTCVINRIDDLIKQSIVLSKILANDFNCVRVDWMIYKNKILFEELTFTPYSGLHKFISRKIRNNFSNWLIL